jgi:hypothetical protein
VLGSQSLTVLRDSIFCLTDVNLNNVERQENAKPAEMATGNPLKLTDPSGYFYIGGTFYNDMRDDEATDCSEPIRRHLRYVGPINLELAWFVLSLHGASDGVI